MNRKHIFENSIVVFLDILGFKKIIENEEESSKVVDLLYKFRDFNLSFQEQYTENKQKTGHSINIQPNIVSFSDHIILSIPLYRPVESAPSKGERIHFYLQEIKNYISKICFAALLDGVILRGAISIGKHYSDLEKNIFMGDALIEAINNEEKVAIYPRVIISDSLIRYSKKFHFSGTLHERISKKDFDGINYIDYLYFGLKDLGETEIVSTLQLIKAYIEKNIESHKDNISVRKKWFWLANYFDQTLDNLIKEKGIKDDYSIIKPIELNSVITVEAGWDKDEK